VEVTNPNRISNLIPRLEVEEVTIPGTPLVNDLQVEVLDGPVDLGSGRTSGVLNHVIILTEILGNHTLY